jgi:hypothetical protein
MYAFISAAAIRQQTAAAQQKEFNAHAVVVIKGNANAPFHSYDDFIGAHATHAHVTGYFAFTDFLTYSDSITPLPKPEVEGFGFNEQRWVATDNLHLLVYTDISMSTHFQSGSRQLISGKLAVNSNEVNISYELAALNSLALGDSISIVLFPSNPTAYDFNIVGIYRDQSIRFGSELPHVPYHTEQITANARLINVSGFDSVNGNQLLSAATAAEMPYFYTALPRGNFIRGHQNLVYYINHESNISSFIEYFRRTLHERLHVKCMIFGNPENIFILDSSAQMRVIHYLLNRTESGFTWLFIIFGGLSVLFIILLFHYMLKRRAYDICVYRCKGISRNRMVAYMSLEFVLVTAFSYIFSCIFFYYSFTPLAQFIYYSQYSFNRNNPGSIVMGFGFGVSDTARDFIFDTSFVPLQLVFGFVIVILITAVICAMLASFISRIEPMKMLTEH